MHNNAHKAAAQVRARPALLRDVPAICGIIQPYAETGALLPRTVSELNENVRDFVVAANGEGEVVGCGALHLYGAHLAEIRSIAVRPHLQGKGIGRVIVDALLAEAQRHTVTCVCLFTRTPAFFSRLGFAAALRAELPDKIYKDCVHCPKLLDCDEVAMVMGRIPANTNGLRDSRIQIPLIQIK